MEIHERHEEVGGLEVFWRQADPPQGVPPTLYVHGVPTSSDEWPAFLEKTGGVALDMPGFGRSDKPASFDYSIPGYRRFLLEFIEHVGLERFSLVVHDWGGQALSIAQEMPERLERLVLFTCVPLLPGYRWHRVARIWRTPLVGELMMGFTFRWNLRLLSYESNAKPGPLPDDFIDSFYRWFDQGTQRAILKLYRSAPPEVLARHGERLGDIKAPTLVLWPDKDPYIGPEWGPRYAEALPNSELEMVADCGHWMWLDQPELIDRATRFLTG